MSFRIRTLLCISILFSASMASILASEKSVSIQIRPAAETIQAIRYQSGPMPDKPWKIAPMKVSPIELKEFDSETDFLFVQQAQAENNWSDLYTYQYNKQEKSWASAEFPPKGFVRFRIKPTDGAIEMLRFQYGKNEDQSWKTADSSYPLVIEAFDSGKEFLFVQQAALGKEWSSTYTYQYDYLQERWSLFVPKEETKNVNNISLDVKAYGLLPTGCTSELYSFLGGGGIQANISLGKVLGYTGLTYSMGPSKCTWVNYQQAVALAIGIGYPITLSTKVEFIPEVGYGVILHFLDADLDKDGTFKFEFFVDQQIRLALYLTYALDERYKLFFAPLGVIFFEKNDLGIMYGCQAGIRFSL
ncbi:MAG TPA: hypothetical protein VJY54_00690 [Lachnospiraceae bacterium]|nr:hypothetical protein [Lachnospiraceae bacterium]